MPSLDFWDIAAKRPSCLMAVTPYRGGTWASMLKPGVAMPSSTPRNFATEPATWYDLWKWCAENVSYSDDYELEFSFLSAVVPSGPILYASNSFFGVYGYADGNVRVFDSLGYGYNGASLSTTAQANTKYTILHTSIGTTGKFYWNGELKLQRTKSPAYWNISVAPGSTFSGNIFCIRMTNLTTGKSWSYPTWAEDKRLLTFDNGRTDRGVFEPADTAQIARIDTALDLRGKVSDYTVIVDFEAANLSNYPSKQELCGQGPAVVQGTPAICSMAYLRSAGALYNIQLSHEVAGNRVLDAYTLPSPLVGQHILVGVIKISDASTTMRLYLDGVLVATSTVVGHPTGNVPSTRYKIWDGSGAWTLNYGGIHKLLLFDYAMTAAEIAQFK